MIAILTQSCKYFAAPFLARALNADLYTIDHSQNAFFGNIWPVKKFDKKSIPADHLIIIGLRALRAAQPIIKNYKTVAVIFSDTNACIHSGWWNKFVSENGIHVYAMPDLKDYCRAPFVPVYQAMSIPEIPISRKTDATTICHSPGEKQAYKGTAHINNVIKRLKKNHAIEYILCENLSWQKCLYAKAKADIFIDQVVLGNPNIPQVRFGGKIPYKGALGKSGLEAMLLGCCVVSGCPELVTEPFFDNPPIIYTDYSMLEETINQLIADRSVSSVLSIIQKEWAEKYTAPEFVAAHITRHINEAV